jgi:hypothetical protein
MSLTINVINSHAKPSFYSVVYEKDCEIVTEGRFTREWAETVTMERREQGYKAVMRKLERV